jgi:hypothetical protein
MVGAGGPALAGQWQRRGRRLGGLGGVGSARGLQNILRSVESVWFPRHSRLRAGFCLLQEAEHRSGLLRVGEELQ